MTTRENSRCFDLGHVCITPAALETVVPFDVIDALRRHVSGDWGDCVPDDREANDRSVDEGARILSVYHDRNGRKFWILTEADRSATTIMLPEDY